MQPGMEAMRTLKVLLPPRVVAGLWAAWLLRGQPMSTTVQLALEAYFARLGDGPPVELPFARTAAPALS